MGVCKGLNVPTRNDRSDESGLSGPLPRPVSHSRPIRGQSTSFRQRETRAVPAPPLCDGLERIVASGASLCSCCSMSNPESRCGDCVRDSGADDPPKSRPSLATAHLITISPAMSSRWLSSSSSNWCSSPNASAIFLRFNRSRSTRRSHGNGSRSCRSSGVSPNTESAGVAVRSSVIPDA
jgi:hypothetical protein